MTKVTNIMVDVSLANLFARSAMSCICIGLFCMSYILERQRMYACVNLPVWLRSLNAA